MCNAGFNRKKSLYEKNFPVSTEGKRHNQVTQLRRNGFPFRFLLCKIKNIQISEEVTLKTRKKNYDQPRKGWAGWLYKGLYNIYI